MFKLDETCIAYHLNERRVKGINEDDDLSSMVCTMDNDYMYIHVHIHVHV